MKKPKIIIVGISNDKEICRKAIEETEKLGFECLVIDPLTILDTPMKTIDTLKMSGQIYPAELIYKKNKYHKKSN